MKKKKDKNDARRRTTGVAIDNPTASTSRVSCEDVDSVLRYIRAELRITREQAKRSADTVYLWGRIDAFCDLRDHITAARRQRPQ